MGICCAKPLTLTDGDAGRFLEGWRFDLASQGKVFARGLDGTGLGRGLVLVQYSRACSSVGWAWEGGEMWLRVGFRELSPERPTGSGFRHEELRTGQDNSVAVGTRKWRMRLYVLLDGMVRG